MLYSGQCYPWDQNKQLWPVHVFWFYYKSKSVTTHMGHTHGPTLASDPVPSVCPNPFHRSQRRQTLAPYHASNVNGRSLRKIQEIPLKVCASKWELISVSWMLFYLYAMLLPAFKNVVSVATSPKKPIFAQVGPHGLPLDLPPMSMVDRWT
jgi:hypothetical protein